MTNREMLLDMYNRLTSRKLLLCITSVALAIWGYSAGVIDGEKMMTAISVAVTAYTAAEGVSDAVGAWRSQPAAPDQVVNVDTGLPAPSPMRLSDEDVDRIARRGIAVMRSEDRLKQMQEAARPPVGLEGRG